MEMKRSIVLGALVAVGALSVAAAGGQGQPAGSKVVEMRTLGVSDTLYVLTGGGGNSLALVDENSGGVILVDTKLPGWGQPLLDAIGSITDLPVTTIINTHTHGDHTGGNGEIPSAVRIVAHENTKANMAKMDKMDAFKAGNAKFLPNKTYQTKMSLLEGVNRIDLYYFGAGHTNGDTIVVFPAKGLAHVGDLFPSKATPFIDTSNGGSGVAYPDTLAKAVAEIKGVDRVITGHSRPFPDRRSGSRASRPTQAPNATVPGSATLMTWADLQEYADFTRDFLAATRAAFRTGKSVDEAVSDLKLAEKYKEYGTERAKANVQAIYDELKTKK
jgi:glyoxylase-like metal-dependent hydrolase (beta-lactamase superfamily II)